MKRILEDEAPNLAAALGLEAAYLLEERLRDLGFQLEVDRQDFEKCHNLVIELEILDLEQLYEVDAEALVRG